MYFLYCRDFLLVKTPVEFISADKLTIFHNKNVFVWLHRYTSWFGKALSNLFNINLHAWRMVVMAALIRSWEIVYSDSNNFRVFLLFRNISLLCCKNRYRLRFFWYKWEDIFFLIFRIIFRNSCVFLFHFHIFIIETSLSYQLKGDVVKFFRSHLILISIPLFISKMFYSL